MKLVKHGKRSKLAYHVNSWSVIEREQLKFIVPQRLPDYYAALEQPCISTRPESLVPPLKENDNSRSSSNTTMLDYVWFKLVRLLYWLSDWLLRLVFRYSLSKGWHSERKQGAHFDNSAHVTRVLMKGRKIELEGARINNFILR